MRDAWSIVLRPSRLPGAAVRDEAQRTHMERSNYMSFATERKLHDPRASEQRLHDRLNYTDSYGLRPGVQLEELKARATAAMADGSPVPIAGKDADPFRWQRDTVVDEWTRAQKQAELLSQEGAKVENELRARSAELEAEVQKSAMLRGQLDAAVAAVASCSTMPLSVRKLSRKHAWQSRKMQL